MRKLLLTTAFLLASTSAFATDHKPAPAAPGSSSVSGAAALSASQSRASAAAVSGSRSSATGGRASAAGGSSNVTVTNSNGGGGGYGGGYSARGNTPDVVLGAINGGNSCGLGAGVGGSGPGAGGIISWMWSDRSCERRQTAALLINMGDTRGARERLCFDDETRRAFFSSGTPCARDARGWDPK